MKRTISNLMMVGAVVAAYLAGAFAPLERGLSSLRFQVLATDMTGDVVMVGIDSQSLQELNVWPWPRNYHATVIDRLMAAGAAQVALDIDFSSSSSPDADRALQNALRRADGKVILATFKQPGKDERGNDVYFYTAPFPSFAREARLGHVNVQVAADSLVWEYETAARIAGVSLSGMATMMAGEGGAAHRSFTIDYALQPETLPYLSYVDVLQGNFDPSLVRGRNIIVGAVALELGDRIPVPVHQVLPGPVVQALIADTILQDRELKYADPRLIAVIAVVIGMLMANLIARWSWQGGGVVVVSTGGVALAISFAVQANWPLIVHTTPVLFGPALVYLVNLTRSIDRLTGAFRRERFESLYRRAMMGAVVDSGFDGIMIADNDGNIELSNPSAERITGVETESLIGVPIHSILPWSVEIESLYSSQGQNRHANTVGPLELSLVRGAEELTIEMIVTTARLSVNANRRKDGVTERIVYIYTFRDISDRKHAEAAQKKAMEVATEANRAKTEFLANMSHELRTPLNAIIGFSDIMKTEMMGPLGADQYREYIRDINGSGQHLLEVVNDILDMSKIESGEMTLTEGEIFLPHIIEASRRLVDERAKAAELTLETDVAEGLPELTADDRLVKQMLLNLLTNAIKFTPAAGTVGVGAYLDDDGSMVLLVRDTGIGIALADFDVILEPFGQADASLSREYEGTGLGLPLVKAMIELHGGKFEMESTVGEGTTVRLRFPTGRVVPARAGRANDEIEAAVA